MRNVQPAKVRPYWEKVAKDFDAIYSGEKSPFKQWMDRVFRKDMYERLRLTVEECAREEVRTMLDVGTGSGRFCLPLAKDKERILGIDFSETMIALARKRAEEAGVTDRIQFEVGDFLKMAFNETFDAIISIGVFDYIRDPHPFLEKMARMATQRVITTYPVLFSWRVPVRWVRLNLAGCPVFFYSASRVQAAHEQAGLKVLRMERVGKIWFVVAEPAKADA